MRALVSIPRSPTRTMSVRPKRARSLSTWVSTVAGSAVLPGNASTATGQPRASVSRPNSIWGRSGRWSRLWPWRASGQWLPSTYVLVRSYSTRLPSPRWRPARARSTRSWRVMSQSIAPYSSFSSAPSMPRQPARVVWPSEAAVASLEAGESRRATMRAVARSRRRDGRRSRRAGSPRERTNPRTAATWPWGRLRRIRSASPTGRKRSPRRKARMSSISGSGRWDRLARVCFLTLPSSRYELRSSVLVYSRPPWRLTTLTTCMAVVFAFAMPTVCTSGVICQATY
jgi:hypothetical protein